jgi:hypothetical protein
MKQEDKNLDYAFIEYLSAIVLGEYEKKYNTINEKEKKEKNEEK